MEEKLNFFTALYNKFLKNPIQFTLFILLGVFCFIVYNQLDNIVENIPTPEYENAQFQASLSRDEQINAALDDAREFYQADGIVIGQFHNGQYDLTRLPFTKISVTYYSGNLTKTDQIYDTRPLSTMNKIMLEMWKDKEKPVCISSRVKDLKDIPYRQRLENTGLGFVTLCPLTNILNYPIGYLSTGYTREDIKEEDMEVALDYQRLLASRISGYLQEGSVREKGK